jgi:Relaxase/Mobilisation nuclease domain
VRNPDGETLTRKQWERVADRIESKLGYGNQPRAIAFHRDEKTGHEHMHIAWSRIDVETMTAVPLPFFKLRLKEVCREMEGELGLTRVRNDRDTPVRAANRDQDEQARRLGVDVREVRQTIHDCWERSDNGASFRTALADEGLTLAKGDRRDYIVIDHEGGMHALGMRVLGTTAAETRARMADIDREQLPTVEQARELLVAQREAQARPIFTYHANEQSLEREDPLRKAGTENAHIERHFVGPRETAPLIAEAAPSTYSNDNELGKIEVDILEATPIELTGIVSGLAEAMDDGLKVIGAVAALVGDNKPPPPQSKEEAQARKDAAIGRLIDAERMLHDRAYRREIEQQEREHRAREEKTLDEEYQQISQRY